MEIKKQVIVRTIAGEHMLVPTGDTVFQYNGVFMLTESAHLLWKAIVDGSEKEDLVNILMEEYGIDIETAAKDVTMFLEKLSAYGVI